jgi:hypothetical protein
VLARQRRSRANPSRRPGTAIVELGTVRRWHGGSDGRAGLPRAHVDACAR